uniref:Uncharacterized protein n=1 Tax=Plectus sambesii TaxID=2011161 RepID=A0A914VL43_9BILA
MSTFLSGTLIALLLMCYTANIVDADFDNYSNSNRRQPSLIMLTRGGFNPSRYRNAKRHDVVTEEQGDGSQPFFNNYLYQLLRTVNAPIAVEE